MEEAAELPDVSFFGLVVKGGVTATYRIENEPGLMEICHLTNCALCSTSTSTTPVYVKIKSPDVVGQFVLGALIPGKILSFTTDMLITPDTEFCHTGDPEDEVHLTGYRSIDASTLLLEDDEDDDAEDDDEDDEDGDFIDDGADEASEGETSDEEVNALGSGDSDKNAEESEPELDERMLKRSLQTTAKSGGKRQAVRMDPEDSEDDDGDGVNASDIAQKMIDVLEQGASGEGDVSMDEGDEEDETLNDDVDNSADPSAKAQAIQKAKQKQIEIQREKKLQKRQLRESSGKSSDAPEEAPAKRSKQDSESQMPCHPDNSPAPSRQFAEAAYSHVKDHPAGVPLASLQPFRPKSAPKIGKLLHSYATWFKRETVKSAKGVFAVEDVLFGNPSKNVIFSTPSDAGTKDIVKLADGV